MVVVVGLVTWPFARGAAAAAASESANTCPQTCIQKITSAP